MGRLQQGSRGASRQGHGVKRVLGQLREQPGPQNLEMAPCQKLQSWGNTGSSCTPISGLEVMKFHVELKLLGTKALLFFLHGDRRQHALLAPTGKKGKKGAPAGSRPWKVSKES